MSTRDRALVDQVNDVSPSARRRAASACVVAVGLIIGSLMMIATAGAADAAGPRLEYVGKQVFIATPKRGVNLKAWSYYTQPTGLELFCRYSHQVRSDSVEVAFEKYSPDNGRTWGEPVEVPTKQKVAGGVLRFGERPGFADPETGVLVIFGGSVLLPNDNPLEAMSRGRPGYKLSRDGGRTYFHEANVVHVGDEFNEDHPLPGVWSNGWLRKNRNRPPGARTRATSAIGWCTASRIESWACSTPALACR